MSVGGEIYRELGGDFNVVDRRMRFGNGLPDFTHRFKVRGERILEVASGFFRVVSPTATQPGTSGE